MSTLTVERKDRIDLAGGGWLLLFAVLAVYSASDMASFGFLTPLFGVLFGWLMLGETITIEFIGALALVCIGIALVNREKKSVRMV